eukprot:4896816-Amphidinium_carterae.1
MNVTNGVRKQSLLCKAKIGHIVCRLLGKLVVDTMRRNETVAEIKATRAHCASRWDSLTQQSRCVVAMPSEASYSWSQALRKQTWSYVALAEGANLVVGCMQDIFSRPNGTTWMMLQLTGVMLVYHELPLSCWRASNTIASAVSRFTLACKWQHGKVSTLEVCDAKDRVDGHKVHPDVQGLTAEKLQAGEIEACASAIATTPSDSLE